MRNFLKMTLAIGIFGFLGHTANASDNPDNADRCNLVINSILDQYSKSQDKYNWDRLYDFRQQIPRVSKIIHDGLNHYTQSFSSLDRDLLWAGQHGAQKISADNMVLQKRKVAFKEMIGGSCRGNLIYLTDGPEALNCKSFYVYPKAITEMRYKDGDSNMCVGTKLETTEYSTYGSYEKLATVSVCFALNADAAPSETEVQKKLTDLTLKPGAQFGFGVSVSALSESEYIKKKFFETQTMECWDTYVKSVSARSESKVVQSKQGAR